MESPKSAEAPRIGLAIASLVLGIVACVFSLFVVGALFGLIGLILGLVHVFKKRGPNNLAWWGVGLSIFSILASIAMGFFFYFFTTQMKSVVTGPDGTFNKWIGVKAPDIEITTLDGKPIKLSQLKGKRVVLDFWATWCGPCVIEMPHFERLYAENSRDDLIIIGISNEGEAKVRSFVAQKGIKYPIAVSRSLPSPFKDIRAIPTTFFIDRNGILQSVLMGSRDFNELKDHALTTDFQGNPQSAPMESPPIPNRVASASSLRAPDPWVGIWKLNPAKSKLQSAIPADISASLVIYREADPNTAEITATQVRKDGSRVVEWKCKVPKSGGMQNYQQGAPEGVAIVKTVIDDHTQQLTYLQNGMQVDLATIVLSRDGKSYTLSGTFKDANGQPYQESEVYEKQ